MRPSEIKHSGNWQELIPRRKPVIFIERPLKIFKISLESKNISFTDRIVLLARVVQTLAFAILIHDFTNHAGFLVREEDKIYRIHTAGGKPVKEEAPEYFINGCDWLIPNDAKIEDPEIYRQIIKSAEAATDPDNQCKTDVIGIMLTPFCRKKKNLDDYEHNFYPEEKQKYTCTEFVARVWKKYGFDIANPDYKLNKIFMGDIVSRANKSRLFQVFVA